MPCLPGGIREDGEMSGGEQSEDGEMSGGEQSEDIYVRYIEISFFFLLIMCEIEFVQFYISYHICDVGFPSIRF